MRWPAAIVAALLTMLMTWAVATPRYGAPDELAHTVKAYATAHGQLLGATRPDVSHLIRTFVVPKQLVSGEPWCFASFPEVNAGCAVTVSDNTLVSYESSAATYPVPYYAAIGTAVRVIGASDSARDYRVVSIGISTIVLAAALMLFRKTFGGNSAVVLLALNPMAIFVLASTNPATIEVAGMLVLWALVARQLASDAVASRRELLMMSTVGAALVVIRPVALPWVIIAICGYFILEWRSAASVRPQRAREFTIAAIPIALSVAASVMWSRIAGVGLADERYIVDAPTIDTARLALGRTALLFRQGFGVLGWLDTQLPSGIFGLWIAMLVWAGSAVIFFGDRRTKLLMVGLVGCWIVYPAMYATLARTPAVWQGRYNLPLLGGLVVCTLVALTRDQLGAPARQVSRVCAVAFVFIEVVALHQSLRRSMVGASGDILLRSPGWRPPLGPWVLLAVNLAAATLLAALLISEPSGRSPAGSRSA